MTKYKVTVQGIHFKQFESQSGYKMNSLLNEVRDAVEKGLILGFDNTKPMDIQITKE